MAQAPISAAGHCVSRSDGAELQLHLRWCELVTAQQLAVDCLLTPMIPALSRGTLRSSSVDRLVQKAAAIRVCVTCTRVCGYDIELQGSLSELLLLLVSFTSAQSIENWRYLVGLVPALPTACSSVSPFCARFLVALSRCESSFISRWRWALQ